MRREKTRKRGRVLQVGLLQIVVAGGLGYLLVGGGGQTAALRSADLSVTEAVALRFPDDWPDTPPVPRALLVSGVLVPTPAPPASTAPGATAPASTPITASVPAVTTVAATNSVGDGQLALFSPEPMLPRLNPPQSDRQGGAGVARQAEVQPAIQARMQVASAGPTVVSTDGSAAPASASAPMPTSYATVQPSPTRTAVPTVRRRVANRPGYMLDDAQIASIKERLHLTPDQQEMWPAVELALRNMAYTHVQEARGRAASGSDAQVAAVDPNSVQGLKSAAVPLIMSFNSEQKEEVRNLVHVMGLDQLASQF